MHSFECSSFKYIEKFVFNYSFGYSKIYLISLLSNHDFDGDNLYNWRLRIRIIRCYKTDNVLPIRNHEQGSNYKSDLKFVSKAQEYIQWLIQYLFLRIGSDITIYEEDVFTPFMSR